MENCTKIVAHEGTNSNTYFLQTRV